jgi:predicted nucleic acid-binding protein
VTLLDAYALVALVADEAAAPEVEDLLRAGDCRVAPVNLAEAVDVTQRIHGVPLEDIRGALDPLVISGHLRPVVTDADEAWLAAELRARHYDRRTKALSMADCLLLAHAIRTEDAIATSDPALASAARVEDVDVIGLPDSSGKRP